MDARVEGIPTKKGIGFFIFLSVRDCRLLSISSHLFDKMKGETKSNSRASAPAHRIDIRIIFSRVFLSFSSSFVHAKPLNFEMFTDDDER